MNTMGLVHNWSGLITAIFFFGFGRGWSLPGINYCLSCWYIRDEILGYEWLSFFGCGVGLLWWTVGGGDCQDEWTREQKRMGVDRRWATRPPECSFSLLQHTLPGHHHDFNWLRWIVITNAVSATWAYLFLGSLVLLCSSVARPRSTIRRNFSWRYGDLPLYFQHHHLGLQQ